MALELVKVDCLSPLMTREIDLFLESQQTSHIFQFPQWIGPGALCAVVREGGGVKWLGSFGIQLPLGSRVPWVRAMIVNRGPVCDDRKLWEAAAEEFVQQMAKEGLMYIDVRPDWLQASDAVGSSSFSNPTWQQAGVPRTSLRLNLTVAEDKIFGNFRKNTRYEIRRAERTAVAVTTNTSVAEIDEFLRLYGSLAVRKGFLPDSPDNVRRQITWLTRGESPRGALLLARLEGSVLGGAVIGRSGRPQTPCRSIDTACGHISHHRLD